MLFSVSALALIVPAAVASPLHRASAAPEAHRGSPVAPIATKAPTLNARQDDGLYSYPASGCITTIFPEETITQTVYTEVDGSLSSSASEAIVSGGPACLCAPSIIAGFFTDTSVTSGSQPVYCATSNDNGASTPTGTPVTWVTDPICMASKNADTWSSADMGNWVSSQATAMEPYSTGFAAAIEDQLSGLSARGYSCEWSYGGAQCNPGEAADVCSENPQAAFATMAIANFVNYLDDVFQTLQVVINTMTPTFATFPETFNPNNITELPGSGSTSGSIGAAMYFVGSVAALIPGANLVTAGSTAASRLGTFGAAAYMAGSGAGVSNLGGSSPSGSIEVQFLSFSAIQGLLGELAQNVADGFSAFASSALSEIPPDGFETDPRQLPSLLADGAFAEPHPPFSLSMAQNLTAAIAGPGINMMWQYQGTVVAKVNQNNLPIDPCDGNQHFTTNDAYCDGPGGNMFALFSQPEDPFGESVTAEGMDDPEKYAVPGFDELSRYNLTIYDVAMSAWNNQQKYGPASSGPDAEDFINNLIDRRPETLPRDEYIFFNLHVCDFDAIDMEDETLASMGEDNCGSKTEENADCWFFFYLGAGCPLQFAPDDGTDTSWPWGYHWLIADADDCGLVDEDGNSLCE